MSKQLFRTPILWGINITIPFYEVAAYLPEGEYERLIDSVGEDIRIKLSYDYSPADCEVGLSNDSMDYCGWDWVDRGLSTAIDEAITQYIEDNNIGDEYSDKAYESMVDYCDYLKYGIDD